MGDDIKSETKQAVDDARAAMMALSRLLERKTKGDKEVVEALVVASLSMGRLAGLLDFLADYVTNGRH